MNRLQGKVAVVTGASKGIGAAIAKGLASEGAAVVVNYASSREGADAVVAAIVQNGGKAVAVQGDVSQAGDVARLFSETKNAYGHLDILVNNAGRFGFAPLEAVTEEDFHRYFNTNVLGLLLTSRDALPLFGENGGSIINIGSGSSQIFLPGTAVYAATKGAVDVITGVLAKELGPKKIRVNSINPGPVDTEGARSMGMPDEMMAPIIAQTPLGRIGQPNDIAQIAVFLASDEAGWLTGETLLASGGLR